MSAPLFRKKGPLFAMAYHRFLRDPSIKLSDKGVFLCIKSHKDADDQCIPPVDLIAAELGVTRDTVFKSIKRLEAQGLLARVARSEGGNQVSNQYFFHDLHYVKHRAKIAPKGRLKKQTAKVYGKTDTRKIRNRYTADSNVVREDSKIIPLKRGAA